MKLTGVKVVVVGANNAALFQKVLIEEYGAQSPEFVDWNIYDCDEGVASPQEKAVILSRRKVFRAAEDVTEKKIILGFHSIAIFHGEELKAPKSAEEFEQTLMKTKGHPYDYYVDISAGRTSENGGIQKFSNKLISICPEIVKMSDEKIHSFVEKIPLERIPACSLAYRPLMNEDLKTFIKDVESEKRIFTNVLKTVIRELLNEMLA